MLETGEQMDYLLSLWDDYERQSRNGDSLTDYKQKLHVLFQNRSQNIKVLIYWVIIARVYIDIG